MKELNLTENDFINIPEWEELSASQKILSQVKEKGEQRFQENNKISFSSNNFNPGHFVKKIWKHITKSWWISKVVESSTFLDRVV